MATEQAGPPIRDHVEWALMWVILGMALWTIIAAIVVTFGMYFGVI